MLIDVNKWIDKNGSFDEAGGLDLVRHGYEWNEEQEIRNFLKRVKADPVSVDWKTEGFYWYNNANNTPGECVDFIFHRCNN